MCIVKHRTYVGRVCIRLLVRGIKNRHLIGRRNDVTANMATLAVCMCLTASRLLDIPRSSVWVSQVQHAHVQKFTGARELFWLAIWVL